MGVKIIYKIEVILKNRTGLHARPASIFVNEASKYVSEITLEKEGKEYNAKSIIGVLTMGAARDTLITIKAEGKDEKVAVQALKELIDNNFNE